MENTLRPEIANMIDSAMDFLYALRSSFESPNNTDILDELEAKAKNLAATADMMESFDKLTDPTEWEKTVVETVERCMN